MLRKGPVMRRTEFSKSNKRPQQKYLVLSPSVAICDGVAKSTVVSFCDLYLCVSILTTRD